MRRRTLLAGAAAALGSALTPDALAQPARFIPYPKRADVQAFIDEFASAQAIERRWLERLFARGRYLAAVERLMQPPIPFAQRNWLEYRARYLDERRLREGVAFWNRYRAALERARNDYGVPPQIIVAILGVETFYGRLTGRFRTLDVLLTLTFDYLRRADYYRAELAQFLLLMRERGADPLAVQGSFAGAIGMPQFMPSSIRRWAVDFDGDGRVDLERSAADSIGSIANFLAQHGWQRDEPILLAAQASEETIEEFGGGILATTPWSFLMGAGVDVDSILELDTPVLLIDLPLVDGDGRQRREYRVGTRSFSAVLHYNRSYFYGAAVVELADALRQRAVS